MYVYEYLGIIKDMRDKKDEGPQNFLRLKWFTGLELSILNRKSSTTHTENQKQDKEVLKFHACYYYWTYLLSL